MDSSNNNEIQRTADYYASMNAPKKRWRTSIILGVLGIISGFFYSLIFDPINILLILIGVVLLVAGIRARTTTKLNSLLFTGGALLLTGIWNLLVVTSNLYVFFTYYRGYTYSFTLTWGIMLGLFCIGWAGETFALYRRFSPLPYQKPTDQGFQEMENIIKPIINATADNDHEILEFTKIGGWSSLDHNVKVNRNAAIVVSKDKSAIFFVRPEEFNIVDKGRMGITQYRKAEIHIKDKKLNGRMKKLSMQRYELWKNSLNTQA